MLEKALVDLTVSLNSFQTNGTQMHLFASYHDPELNAILVVDDESMTRESLAECLQSEGYPCATANGGLEALEMMKTQAFALVLTDLRMPQVNGFRLLEIIGQEYPSVSVVVITGMSDAEAALMAMHLGACDYIRKPFDLDRVLESVNTVLKFRRRRLEEKQAEQSLGQLIQTQAAALQAALQAIKSERQITPEVLLETLDSRGHESYSHTQRIRAYAMRLGEECGLPRARLLDIGRGALLHDVGKIGIPDSILLKQGKLTPQEEEAMKRHPSIGYQVVSGARFLKCAAHVVLYHHEHYDGSGYTVGLRGARIPVEARIVTLVDSYDAMTTERPYREKVSTKMAREEIIRAAGTQLDPILVQDFLKVPLRDWDRIRSKYD